MKKRIKKEDLERVRNLDLLTYFKNYDPDELIRNGITDYKIRSHSSLHLSNGLWCHWASGIGGKSALDYLIKVEGWEFLEAAIYLRDTIESKPPIEYVQKTRSIYKFNLPKPAKNNDVVIDYLVNQRHIDKDIIQYCIEHFLLYESLDHSVIFVGYDEQQIPRYACKRECFGTVKKDLAGSDKRFSFSITNNNSKKLRVFESVIDLLSYMTIIKRRGRDYQNDNFLSTAGVTPIGKSIQDSAIPIALECFLQNNSQIKDLYLHFDNDYAGKSESEKIIFHLQDKYNIVNEPPKKYKDFNEQLIHKSKHRIVNIR